jgi:hypothetical protein
MPASPLPKTWIRPTAEIGLLMAFGVFMAMLAPYGTDTMRPGSRWAYWLISIVGGGLIGIGIDEFLGRSIQRLWLRVGVDSLVMTPGVAVLVILDGRLIVGPRYRLPHMPDFLWQVFIVCVAVMAVRALAWRAPKVMVETRTVVQPPLPLAEAAFRRRLSARRRTARLLAVEAHDHYLRVHTDAGAELVTMRMSDAMEELAGAHGYRTHRSWWVAADAIEAVQWKKGIGEARLTGDLTVPVSRSCAPQLKAAGWF